MKEVILSKDRYMILSLRVHEYKPTMYALTQEIIWPDTVEKFKECEVSPKTTVLLSREQAQAIMPAIEEMGDESDF